MDVIDRMSLQRRNSSAVRHFSEFDFSGVTAAVTEPPPKNVDFKKRAIGGFGSPLGSLDFFTLIESRALHHRTVSQKSDLVKPSIYS